MPIDYRSELIRLFACNPRGGIESVAEFRQLRDRFAHERYFQAESLQIESAKGRVETALGDNLTRRESVQAAIKLLLMFKGDNERRGLCYELIVAGYKPGWTSAQQEHFEVAWQTIKLEYDYFLSFTSRRPNAPGDNPVNNSYKHFITSVIGGDEFKTANRKMTNLLAATVHSLLSGSSIKGFYFPEMQYDNALTEQKLEQACDNCVVFVQLVQTIMFDQPENGRKNYCHFEWERAKNRFAGPDAEKRILFIVAASDRNEFKDYLPYVDYGTWYDHFFKTKDPPYLPEIVQYDGGQIAKMRARLKEIIVPQIRAARLRFIDAVP